MARYVDAELLNPEDFENCTPYQAQCIINEIPTADVVPKSEAESWLIALNTVMEQIPEMKVEVARKIFEEIEEEIEGTLKNNYNVRLRFENSDELWHNINGKINALRGIEYFIAELRKKYIGDNDGTN